MKGGTIEAAHNGGFTIAELVIASTILLFTATACISGIMFSVRSSQLIQRRTEALGIANSQIEFARNLSFDDVATVIPSNGLPAGRIPNLQTLGAYTVAASVAYGTYGANQAARYKTISVTVSWSEPTTGSLTVSSIIAGASGTQDYNFGSVSLTVQDEGTPAAGVIGVTVLLTDANGRTYSAVTSASGVVLFTYVPSGSITMTATMPGRIVDALTAPTCVANTTTPYGPVTAHMLRTGVVQCLTATGTPVAGVTVGLSAGPSVVASVQTDAGGRATFPGQLIKGSYTIGIAHAFYQLAAPATLTIGNADANTSASLAVKPAMVTATRSSKGTIYVWNSTGTLNTSMSSATSKPYSAVFTLTNPDIQPRVYYFTSVSTFATTTSATVTPGLTNTVTVP